MQPIGDKVVLIEYVPPTKDSEILITGGQILATVFAVGKGIPFGRGEFYEPTLKVGELVFVGAADWTAAPAIRVRLSIGQRHALCRVLHERQCLVQVGPEEL
jgi:co-chaperonin GroES (HSP10)